jgi:hypothetical protein
VVQLSFLGFGYRKCPVVKRSKEMPFGGEGVEQGLGLAVSVGGFRATLFHIGSFWRLNELGYLPKLALI